MSQLLEAMADAIGRGELTLSDASDHLRELGYEGARLRHVLENLAAEARRWRRRYQHAAQRAVGFGLPGALACGLAAVGCAWRGWTTPMLIFAISCAMTLATAGSGLYRLAWLRRRFGRIV